ncbi:hypothetical protein N0V84_008941 [Fusarium piperis]|uniref:Protein kinase domain-containing protein n=1 Tax=Fusarium piperis TaxID=1435070 RepID=A0A9W9BL47_9HYPO|nr:hypothetical protein N0V84_008941 [Fusarium piperis]
MRNEKQHQSLNSLDLIMTTQDENTGLKPAPPTTPDPPVMNASADVAGLDKQSEGRDDGDLLLSKPTSTVPTGDDVVVEQLLTAEPPTEQLDADNDTLPPNKPNSVVDIKDGVVVELLLTAEPPTEQLDADNDTLPPNKPNSVVDAKDDAVVELLLTAEPPTEQPDRHNDVLPPKKKSKLVAEHKDDEGSKSPSTTELKPPAVNDFKDFNAFEQIGVFNSADNSQYWYTFVMMVDQDSYAVWVGTINAPKDQVSLEQAVNCLHRIPDTAIYPPVTPDMQVVAASGFTLDEETWFKQPLIRYYEKTRHPTKTADMFVHEIKAHHIVEKNPHRNLVKFKGCLEKDGLVVGILQERYPMTLNWRVRAWSQPPYDATALYNDIEAGMKHLHSLGLAHNDLKSTNIMVDAEGRAVIIDLGAAKPLGEHLDQVGWQDGFQMTSCVGNDEIGLRLIKEWLQEHLKKE